MKQNIYKGFYPDTTLSFLEITRKQNKDQACPIKRLKTTRSDAGFTLIELLVVIAIIGLLSSIALVAMTNTRIKSRDTARFATMYQIKNGLDIYYNTGSGYPDQASWNASQTSFSILTCSGIAAFKVPQDPIYVSDPSYAYTYTPGGTTSSGCGGTVYGTYKIAFKTEGSSSYGPAGTTIYLSPAGLSTTAPF